MRERMEFPKKSTHGDRHLTTINGRSYDVYQLIHETRELPIVQLPVANLFDGIVDSAYWNDANGRGFTVRELCDAIIRRDGSIDWDATINENARLAEHIQKVQGADCSYPVLLLPNHGIVDGVHRLTKAHLSGNETIPARIMESLPEFAAHTGDSD